MISVANVTSKKPKPTEADKAAAARLKAIWRALPHDRRPTQDVLAERYGEGGSQSLISQYMNGVIPLNLRAVLFFARELGCRPDDIYPDLPGLEEILSVYRPATGTEGALGKEPARSESAEADAAWSNFTPEQKRRILELVEIAGLIGQPGRKRGTDDVTTHTDKAVQVRRRRQGVRRAISRRRDR